MEGEIESSDDLDDAELSREDDIATPESLQATADLYEDQMNLEREKELELNEAEDAIADAAAANAEAQLEEMERVRVVEAED